MSCHSECHDHAHGHGHGHDHTDDDGQAGEQNNLYPIIDLDRVVCLNASPAGGTPRDLIRPWSERRQPSKNMESEVDDSLILTIPFTANVKLRSVVLKCGPGDHTPKSMQIFHNHQHLTFDDVQSTDPTQTFDLTPSNEMIEYPVKISKFTNVRDLTLYFPEGFGEETIRLDFLALKGDWTKMSQRPEAIVYESQANPADHSKIRGTDEGFTSFL